MAPIHWTLFQGRDFTTWLTELQRDAEAAGNPLQPTTMSGHRSALRFLLQQLGRDLGDIADDVYTTYFRDVWLAAVNGHTKPGKQPLPRNVYVAVCRAFLSGGGSDDIVAHCFATMQ